eukprot:TRINITY_DN17226_c0_g1_i1.p1 TRINITY_DN17226_c0_g1~~TRINITY_DN17226_c0_g1_i1.p1  ORF type:complete len:634 (+),score=106.94 TRINITY_DN17226_c0_g1_i1:81-1982(+)
MEQYILSIDQGTTSSRACLFNKSGSMVAFDQAEFPQHYPQPGWTEHDPQEILDGVLKVCEGALQKAGAKTANIAAIGVTNQRETTIAWDKETGEPLHKAIVWLDTRTSSIVEEMADGGTKDRFRKTTGLPLATYFSALKMKWLLDNVPAVKTAGDEGRLRFGTVDSWLIYKLTGGKDGGVFVTDISNASRYMLMNIETQSWDSGMCKAFGIPLESLPEIKSNSEIYGHVKACGSLAGLPISGSLGDQHAALLGQGCIAPGTSKNTYGTGCFMLKNTGKKPIPSKSGLLTTIGFKLGPDEPTTFAIEGSVACAGRSVQWLRDTMGIIKCSSEIEALAASVQDTGGVTLVPAFAGLFAPHWRDDARAAIVGMTYFTGKAHICRAALEATAFQTVDIIEAMERDTGIKPVCMRVDGGMTVNNLLMQIQADLLGCEIHRPRMAEATALGAAFAAGLAVKFWDRVDAVQEMLEQSGGHDVFKPEIDAVKRAHDYARWKDALQRSFGLANTDHTKSTRSNDKTLRKPKFILASEVQPDQTGVNLSMKVLTNTPCEDGFAEVACADKSGSIKLRLKAEQAGVFKEGDIIRVQNATASMVGGFVRITVNKWGKVVVDDMVKELEVTSSKDWSAVEYQRTAV